MGRRRVNGNILAPHLGQVCFRCDIDLRAIGRASITVAYFNPTADSTSPGCARVWMGGRRGFLMVYNLRKTRGSRTESHNNSKLKYDAVAGDIERSAIGARRPTARNWQRSRFQIRRGAIRIARHSTTCTQRGEQLRADIRDPITPVRLGV